MTKPTASSGNPPTGRFQVKSTPEAKLFTRDHFIRDLKKVARKASPKGR